MSTLQQTIHDQAVQFAEALVRALRSASIDELLAITGAGRQSARTTTPKTSAVAPKLRTGRPGRRSAEDITRTLENIVAVLAAHPEGLRAEQIRAALQLDKRQMPKPIAEGLESGALKKSGQKRATIYKAGPARKRK